MKSLTDLQGENSQIAISIAKVGVTDLVLPVRVQTKAGVQNVVATIDALGSLTKNERGAHMSRTARILNDHIEKVITYDEIIRIVEDLKKQLNSKKINLKLKFTLFMKKYSPVTKNSSYVNYNCWIMAKADGKSTMMSLGTSVLITSLCPVSKSISNMSAHNQRGEVTIVAEMHRNNFWFEDLIGLIERNSSCELYGVLKREDEKYVTEKAYENAKIVEDIVRSIARELKRSKKLGKWSVSCKNFESIHTHNVYAEIVGGTNGRGN
jgi:GTP cyclohydrolase I